MENKNPKDKEEAITKFLIKEERKKDKRPFIVKFIETLIHKAKVFRERRSIIR